MTPQETQDFILQLETLRDAYEKYREIQEQEHALLSRRGPIVEWNILVRQKNLAMQTVHGIENRQAHLKQRWQNLGDLRQRPEYGAVRERLSQLQAQLTRVLTCERMIESLLYSGGYLQSVIAHRTASEAIPPASVPPKAR
ncbi:MAG: hypothetical protein PHV34_21180 [Verrucomicrobiae bacterium]|nr:hypothetical protein [Verrucomicrobiae bacterium]